MNSFSQQNSFFRQALFVCLATATLIFSSCASERPYPGPDKQFEGMANGALTGAGAGAVTGFQLGSSTGPGALVGAGIGAISGAIEGSQGDMTEEQQIQMQRQIDRERKAAIAQNILSEHFRRRSELHPTRDIFPADIFFLGDEVKLNNQGQFLISELAKLNKSRLSYSRVVVAVYSKSNDPESSYAQHLSERRSRELVDAFVRAGLEPRRLSTRPVVTSQPVLIDPDDKLDRYNQAVELITIDR